MTTITPTEEPRTPSITGEGIRRDLLTVNMEDEGVRQFMSGPDSKGGSHNRRRIVEAAVNDRRGSVKRKVGRGIRECEGIVSNSCDSG